MKETAQRRPFAILLVAQVVFLFLVPIVGEDELGRDIVGVGFTGLVLAGIGIAIENRRVMPVLIALVVANVLAQWLAELVFGDTVDQEILKAALGAAYLVFLVGALLRMLARQTRVSIDTLLGGVNVYLLLAIAFALIHTIVENVRPGSYQTGGIALSEEASHPYATMSGMFIYFSFITLTTLGYGDIAPARPVAQFVAASEAVVGQLYVAILIGGLVALWIGGRMDVPSSGTKD